MRRLIINADDFGLTAGVNRGIAEGMRAGAITSCTLMAGAQAFPDAVGRLEHLGSLGTCSDPSVPLQNDTDGARPERHAVPALMGSLSGGCNSRQFSIGCHVVLVDGRPLLPVGSVPSLIGAADGEFRTSFSSFAAHVLARRIDADQVAAEAEEQIRKVQAAGVAVSHVDTHKHVHLLPAVLRAVLRAARNRGVRAIRNPFAPVKPLAFAHLLRRPHLWTRYTEVRILRAWMESFRRAAGQAGMATTDGTFGIVSTGALDLELFQAIIGCIPEGTWELCCHPGHSDADLQQVRTRLHQSRDRELAVLTSSDARDVMKRQGIELISYWDLNGIA